MSMNLEEYTKEKLWLILVETVHKTVMYPSDKAYIRDVILRDNANLTPSELENRLSMPLGEALVILDELSAERRTQT